MSTIKYTFEPFLKAKHRLDYNKEYVVADVKGLFMDLWLTCPKPTKQSLEDYLVSVGCPKGLIKESIDGIYFEILLEDKKVSSGVIFSTFEKNKHHVH